MTTLKFHFVGRIITSGLLACLTCLAASTTLAQEDILQLRNGQKLLGRVASQPANNRTMISPDKGVTVAIRQNHAGRIVQDDAERMEKYQQRAASAEPTADAQYLLGVWCRSSKLPQHSQMHFRRALAMDSDHDSARRAMNFQRVDGRWIHVKDLQHRRGLASVGNRPRLPEALELDEMKKTAMRQGKVWVNNIQKLKKLAMGNSNRAVAATQELANIRDPEAVAAISKDLMGSMAGGKIQSPRALRQIWVDCLAGIRSPQSVQTLVEVARIEPDDLIREQAILALKDYGYFAASQHYMKLLRSKSEYEVRSAARALASLPPDSENAMLLVDALITEHQRKKPKQEGRVNTSFGQDGGGSFNFGSKEEIVKYTSKNEDVLRALQDIAPDQNFGFDEVAWRRFFAAQWGSYDGSFTRDP